MDNLNTVVAKVEHALVDEVGMSEVEDVIGDAKEAAKKLRVEGHEEEAKKLDGMVADLEAALHAKQDAADRKKDAELVEAEGHAAEQAADAAKATKKETASKDERITEGLPRSPPAPSFTWHLRHVKVCSKTLSNIYENSTTPYLLRIESQ